MSEAPPSVSFDEVLNLDLDAVEVMTDESYEMAGVLSYGRGLFPRKAVEGHRSSYSTFYRLHESQLVLSQLFGWEGALALVPSEFVGKFVSSNFPTFRVKEDRADIRYVSWAVKRPALWSELRAKGKGMGVRRVTLNPAALLSCSLPLPPMHEQRRIAAKLDAAAERIRQVREELASQLTDAETLLIRSAHRQDLSLDEKRRNGWREIELGEVMSLALEPVQVQANVEYPNLGIYCFGKGLFEKPPINGIETSATTLYRVKEGQFIYSRLFAFERAYAIVPSEFDGVYVSGEFPAFALNRANLTPEFLYAYFRSPRVWRQLLEGSKGLGSRRIRVHPEQLLAHRLMLPPLAEQETVSAIVRRTNEIKAHAAQITADFEALERSMLAAAFRGELVSAESTERAGSAKRPLDARTYLVQFVPAILGASDGPLSLEEVSRAYALLFQPETLRPLIGATGDAAALRHFAELPPLDAKIFVQMLQELHRAGVIEQDATTHDLQLGKVSAPPIAAAVANDARHLAAILSLVPRETVRTITRKLCPHPAREIFAALT